MLFSAVREYSNKTGQQVSVGFPFQYPFSSGFYNVQSNGLPINVLKLDLTKTPELKTDLLAVPSRDREKLKELGLEYTEVWSKGRWLLIRPTGK